MFVRLTSCDSARPNTLVFTPWYTATTPSALPMKYFVWLQR